MKDKTAHLREIAWNTIALGGSLSEADQADWDALSIGEQVTLQQEARARAQASVGRQIRAEVRTHGEPARKHYAALSPDARRVFGVVTLLRGSATTTQARPRGAGRPRGRTSSARRSSERSGDSGEGSEPPGRPCACGCGSDISHRALQAKYLNDAHAAADRQRRRRSRGRDWSADVSRADPYLRFDAETFARLYRRVEQGCRCNGHHIADPSDGHCLKCGHDRAHGAVTAGFIAAQSVEARRPRRPELFV